MTWFIQIGILILGYLANRAIASYVQGKQRPPVPGPFQAPTVSAGTGITVTYGTCRVQGVVTRFGGAKLVEVTLNQFDNVFRIGKTLHLAFQYKVTCMMVLGYGPISSIANILFGGKYALSDQPMTQQYDPGDGSVVTFNTYAGTVFVAYNDLISVLSRAIMNIFLPNLFGGRGRGGGFSAVGGDSNNPMGGTIRLYCGSRTTGPDEKLEALDGVGNVPHYNDLAYVVLDDVNVGEASIPPSIDWIFYREPTFVIPGGSGTMVINSRRLPGRVWNWRAQDCSAAAILYDILRNPNYGLNQPAHMILGAGIGSGRGISGTFEDAQRQLVAEGLGMSMRFAGTREAAENAIREIERTVDGVLNRDPATFQWKFKLIRNEATTPTELANLPLFDERNIVSLEWHKTEWSETFNVVTVEFSDAERFYEKNTVTLRNDASIALNGELPLPNVQYLGITDRATALKLCARDLKKASWPLQRGQMKVTRAAWSLERGGVFKLSHAKSEVSELLVRVLSMDLGEETDNTISVDLVEEVFGYDDIVRPTGIPTNPSRLARIIPPSVSAVTQSRTGGIGSADITLLDPEHRLTEVAYRTQVGDAAASGWTVVATASPDPTDLTFPFNDHVTDGDLNGVVVLTTPLAAGVDSVIELRLTYVGYSTVADPTSDLRTLTNVIIFPFVGPSASTLSGASNPIVWDVTGKSDDSASVTIPASRALSIIGAQAGFRGRLLINSSGVGGYTFTLPAESIIGDGSSLDVVLNQRDQLSVYWDGSHYWWTHDTSAARPAITFEAALSGSASMTANLQIGARFAAALSGTANLTAALTVPINLAASLSASATLTADLATATASGFVYKRAITIDHTKCGATDTTDVRVAIVGTYAYLATVANGGEVNDANGYDVAFYLESALTTKLDWEIEKYTAATGDVVYWVRVPNVSHTVDTVIYMAYKHPTISTDQSNKTGVWGANAKSVLHFGDGTTLSVADSSVTNEHWNTNGPPTAGTGKVRGGMSVSGAQEVHSDADLSSAAWTSLTAKIWHKPSSNAGTSGILSHGDGVVSTTPSFLIQNNGGTLRFYANGDYREVSQSLTVGTWCQVAIVLVSVVGINGTWRFYKDGAFLSTWTSGLDHFSSSNNLLFFGSGYAGQAQGMYDEGRLTLEAYSDAKILTEYNSENDPSTFYSVGAQMAA